MSIASLFDFMTFELLVAGVRLLHSSLPAHRITSLRLGDLTCQVLVNTKFRHRNNKFDPPKKKLFFANSVLIFLLSCRQILDCDNYSLSFQMEVQMDITLLTLRLREM